MTSCCKNKVNQGKQSINNLKSSIFCGAKGFLTFNLAFLSYLEYGLHGYILQKQKNGTVQYRNLSKGAAFAMKRNTIPFLEMVIIVPFVCFGLPAIIGEISLMQCALICAALTITTCFIVRTFNLREKLLKQTTNYSREAIDKKFSKDSIVYPIFDKDNKHIKYNSPDIGQLLTNRNNFSYCAAFLIFPLKVLQSCILLSLAAVELLEAGPSFFVDVLYDRSFESTKSNLQKSGHLLYASARNLIPMSRFDESVAEFIGTTKVACCGI